MNGDPAPEKPATQQDTRPKITTEQLDTIADLGKKVYAAEWDSNIAKLAEWASQGARNQLDTLFGFEAEKLIAALQRKPQVATQGEAVVK